MFGFDTTILSFIGLATLATGGILYALLYNNVSNDAKQAKRVKSLSNRDVNKTMKATQRLQDASKRRKSVQDSLNELDSKQKQKHGKKITLKKMIAQAGLKISVQQFFIYSVVFGIALTLVSFLAGASLISAGGIWLVSTFGLPRWIVSFIRKRRMKAFSLEFANAVDVIVRGVKSGLPLNDCLLIISKESKEPVKTEFAKIVEAQQMGLTMGESVNKLYDNIPLPEANFFAIVINIQQSAGGNLAEALTNLSAVLRDRKKMEAKIKAMSAEAKASAGIIGSLPFIVAILVYITTPGYIMILFTTTQGNLVLLGAGIWMSMGIMVMKSMINFDF